MRHLAQTLLSLFLALATLVSVPTLLSQTYLSADGKTDTYGLITSKLAPGANPIEVPDASHPAGSPHIRQVLDSELGHYVFQFQIHLIQVTPSPIDNDPSTLDTDRQRNEIKTYDASPTYLKAYAGETVTYRWRFKLPTGFQPSPKFTHIHQIKPVDGNDSTPVLSFLPNVSSGSAVMTLRFYDETNYDQSHSPDNPNPQTLKQVALAPFLGTWVEANEKITFGAHGSYAMSLTRVSDGTVLMSYSNSDLYLLRTGASFYRPKWGIYRSVEQASYLRDETVLFDNFCLAKGTDDCSAAADFDLALTSNSQSVVAGAEASNTTTVSANHGFNGNVILTIGGLPTGATASFDQGSLYGSGAAQLKITTTSVTPPGNYTVTVTATSGSLTHTANLALQVTPVPDFSVSVTPTSQTVTAGGSASFQTSVNPSEGFNSVVTLSVSGAPAGVTPSFDKNSVVGSGTAQLTFSTTTSALPGSYDLAVVGTSGAVAHSDNVSLVIAGEPTFSVSANPSSQSVSAGHSATYIATVTPTNGFNSAVTFSCAGLPTGASCSFSPQSITPTSGGSSTSLTISTLAPTISQARPLRMWGLFAVGLPMIFVLPLPIRRRKFWMALILTVILATVLCSCGGGGSAPAPSQPTPHGGTSTGTYTVTLTAASGSVQKSVPITLTVTQ